MELRVVALVQLGSLLVVTALESVVQFSALCTVHVFVAKHLCQFSSPMKSKPVLVGTCSNTWAQYDSFEQKQ